MQFFSFSTHPSQYRHLKLSVDGELAQLLWAVKDNAPLVPGYTLKLNSYDLGVDIELRDAVERLRFEHPQVKVVVLTSDKDRVFCAGANIPMLATSAHAFKVNFCKFTNETRSAIEDASVHSGQKYIAALNGTTAGGGYELALACDEILLVDDEASVVSLPEVPLLGVLPGTGGLTRLVDKRQVRRDHADVFATTAEGIRGKRALEWRLVDALVPRSRFREEVLMRARALAATVTADKPTHGIPLDDVSPEINANMLTYHHVIVRLQPERRTAELIVNAPTAVPDVSLAAIERAGADFWPLRCFRELDDALLRLRFHYETIGVVLLKTRGNPQAIRAIDDALHRHQAHWLVREVRLLMARTLRHLDNTARSLFAVVDEGSCFVGTLLELGLAADRTYMLDHPQVTIQLGNLNNYAFPMAHGLSRLALRFLHHPSRVREVGTLAEPLTAAAAEQASLVTVVADDIDFAEEVRIAVEERASLSPDALTGMEASLRFPGPETTETKIYGRLSAWQNWIFTRPNATGEHGALTLYGKPARPQFDWRRT